MLAIWPASADDAGRVVTSSRLASGDNALALLVDDHFAVFLREISALGLRKNVEHGFGRSAQPGAQLGHDEWPVDEDGMSRHCVQQGLVGEFLVVEPEFEVRRAFLSERIAHTEARSLNHRDQLLASGWVHEIFDDDRLDTRVADQSERVARRSARRMVVDGDG